MKLARIGIPNIFKRIAFTQKRPLLLKQMFIGCTFVGLSLQQILRMQNFQSTVVSDVNEFSCVLVLEITETNSAVHEKTLKALKEIPNFVQKNASSEELDPVTVGVGFQTKYWERLTKTPQSDYETRAGAHGSMPKGKGNVIVHVKAQSRSLAYETIQKVIQSLPHGSYQVVSEKYGYQYQDGRDLSGFLDGTMNPKLQRQNVAVNENGGSYLIHQIWHHKLDWLIEQPEDQQEKMIGRKKPNSLELRPLPPDSHVARTRSPDNKRLLIVRQSQPFGTVTGEHGLLFLAYAQNLTNFNTMLDRMTGKGDGINDSIMKMSTNTYGNYFYIMKMSTNTYGNYFYVPSLEELQKL